MKSGFTPDSLDLSSSVDGGPAGHYAMPSVVKTVEAKLISGSKVKPRRESSSSSDDSVAKAKKIKRQQKKDAKKQKSRSSSKGRRSSSERPKTAVQKKVKTPPVVLPLGELTAKNLQSHAGGDNVSVTSSRRSAKLQLLKQRQKQLEFQAELEKVNSECMEEEERAS